MHSFANLLLLALLNGALAAPAAIQSSTTTLPSSEAGQSYTFATNISPLPTHHPKGKGNGGEECSCGGHGGKDKGNHSKHGSDSMSKVHHSKTRGWGDMKGTVSVHCDYIVLHH